MWLKTLSFLVLFSAIAEGQQQAPQYKSTVPNPKILILGAVGVGKSSLANVLLGRHFSHDPGYGGGCFKGDVMNHKVKSVTKNTCWDHGHLLNDSSLPKVTVIDTPGVGTTTEEDANIMQDMIAYLKENIKSVNVFLLVFKESDKRMGTEMKNLIRLFINVFGDNFWDNVVLEATFWSHSKAANNERKAHSIETSEDFWRTEHNKHLQKDFNVKINIPAVFIHPTFNRDSPLEDTKFRENVLALTEQVRLRENRTFLLKDIKMALNELQKLKLQLRHLTGGRNLDQLSQEDKVCLATRCYKEMTLIFVAIGCTFLGILMIIVFLSCSDHFSKRIPNLEMESRNLKKPQVSMVKMGTDYPGPKVTRQAKAQEDLDYIYSDIHRPFVAGNGIHV